MAYNSLNNIARPGRGVRKHREIGRNMMIPSRRKLGAAALIIAGLGAFLVPFLLHSPTPQGTSSNNNNNGGHTTPPTTTTPNPTTTTTGTNGGSNNNSGGFGGTCTNENSDHNDTDVSDHKDVSGQNGQSGANDNNNLNVSHDTKDTSNSNNSKGDNVHAYGLLKNQLDTTVALVKSMGTHNPAFHSHNETKTDNETVHTQLASSESSNDHDSSCAEKQETNDD